MKYLIFINFVVIAFFCINVYKKINVIIFDYIDNIHNKVVSFIHLRKNLRWNRILNTLVNIILEEETNLAKLSYFGIFISVVISSLKVLALYFLFNYNILFFFIFIIIFISLVYLVLLEFDCYLYFQVLRAFEFVDLYMVIDNNLVKKEKIDESDYMNIDIIKKKHIYKIKPNFKNKSKEQEEYAIDSFYMYSMLRWEFTKILKKTRKTNNIVNLVLSIATLIKLITIF